ncbi:MAG: class I SAM-dependent methyltransferase [Planctomycetota bacterium]
MPSPGETDDDQAALERLRANWDLLGAEDPHWAVLSVPGKERGGWDPGEFFATGRTEIDEVLRRISSLPLSLELVRALDFGCGVGRLTRALVAHFEQVDGVDISTQMIRRARKLHAGVPGLAFHELEGTRLPFQDGCFDFVYSRLVLQHIATRFALEYVGEFIRVLRGGGVTVFQAPSRALDAGRETGSQRVELESGEAWVEMHVHPRESIQATVASAGGRILAVERDDCAGDSFESLAYLATR